MNSIVRSLVFRWCVWLVLAFPMSLSANRSAMAEDGKAKLNELLDSVRKSRAELQTGIFQATCRTRVLDPSREAPTETTTTIRCCFDHPCRFLRFDRDGEIRARVRSGEGLTVETLKELRSRSSVEETPLRPLVARFIRNQDYAVEWYAIGRRDELDHATCNVELRDPEYRPVRSAPFDVSAAGLFGVNDLEAGRTLNEILDRFRSEAVNVAFVSENEDHIHVWCDNGRFRKIVHINPSRGFTVSSMEGVEIAPDGTVKELPRFKSVAQWNRQGETWVPVSFSTTLSFKSGKVQSQEYDLTWQEVNPPRIADDVFDYRSLEEIWPGLHVFDRRGGKTKHIDTIGEVFIPIGLGGTL